MSRSGRLKEDFANELVVKIWDRILVKNNHNLVSVKQNAQVHFR
ncbi:hypothetical protein CAMRE0001_1440 [Campylobacter rectus RM3267]|uniref:Uncharacterized protein n=1 Tax=Campylobacter rectus RM3267 TaxID=553218 RepID=B9D0B8_CAMRE|nr:hypothetical protein CAMRE0001_1440 [Campylobacter rectus RM3267]